MHTGKYTVFGHVIDGMDVLDRMEKVPTGESWLYGMISLPSKASQRIIANFLKVSGLGHVMCLPCLQLRHTYRSQQHACP